MPNKIPFRFKPTKRKANDGEVSAYTNAQKAEAAGFTLITYTKIKGDYDVAGDITDLLTDLGHLCDQKKLDYRALIKSALMHWETER
jgi:hypothetical protein